MLVTLVIVSSVNGKTTKGNNPHIYPWTSEEDKDFFFDLHKKHNLIVMGRKTYEAAKSIIKPLPERHRVVMTHSPEKYKKMEMPGLEFSNEKPKDLIIRFEKKGYKKMLLVGGSAVTTEFFKARLITDMYQTIEPVIFGSGREIVDESELAIPLQLESVRQLNKKGTLLLHYKVAA